MTNLIDNAVKYTKEGGTININNIMTNKEIKLEISDTGIGIHKDDVSKIFDEFYRSDNAKAAELDGTGLGLPIVKNLIKRYGGNIDVQSILGKGTTFTISFPAK
jgi:two-component system phosphate regulon sensor histidine kinase PhoR